MTGAQVQQQSQQSFLEQLQTGTFNLLETIEKRAETTTQLEEKIQQLDGNIKGALEAKQARFQRVKEEIARANFGEFREAAAQEERDFATACTGLREMLFSFGTQFDDLTKPSDKESAIVTEAENRLNTARLVDLPKAQGAILFRDKKVAAVMAKIAKLESELTSDKERVKQMARDRLMSATLSDSLQGFMTLVARTVDIMTERCKVNEAQLVIVSKGLEKALGWKKQLAEALEAKEEALTQLEMKQQAVEQEMGELAKGSSAYVAKEQDLVRLQGEVEIARGERNEVFAAFSGMERCVEELKIHVKSQQTLRSTHKIFITVLKQDTQKRVVTFQSRLEAMKMAADQQVAGKIDEVGAEVDARSAKTMAHVSAVGEEAVMDMLQKQPERMEELFAISGAQAGHTAHIRELEKAALENMRKSYGLDPTVTSVFSYGDTMATKS